MKISDPKNKNKYYKFYISILPVKLEGKLHWFKRIRRTYIINTDGLKIPMERKLCKKYKGCLYCGTGLVYINNRQFCERCNRFHDRILIEHFPKYA